MRADNVQKFPGRRKISEALMPVAESVPNSSLINVSGYSAEPMMVEEELPPQVAAGEPLVLGGVEAPAIADRYTRPMAEDLPNRVAPERPRRRVFGLFGGRKRSESVAAPIEPSFDRPRSNAAKEIQRQEPQTGSFSLQALAATEESAPRSAEERAQPKARAGDLFADPDDNFEIPAFLRRQKTGS